MIIQDVLEVPAEVAALFSQRTMSLVELPAELEGALADALRASGSTRLLRRRTALLTDELKKRSRTASRGGVHAAEVLAGPAQAEQRPKKRRVQVRCARGWCLQAYCKRVLAAVHCCLRACKTRPHFSQPRC